MNRLWPNSIAWRGGTAMFLAILLVSFISIAMFVNREVIRRHNEAFSQLRATIDRVETSLLPLADRIADVEQDHTLSRDEKIHTLHALLQPVITQLLSPMSLWGVGAGYYSCFLDATIATEPWDEMGHTLGWSLDPEHPASEMYAQGIAEQESIAEAYRGRVAAVRRLVYHEGAAIGHTWANMPVDVYYAPLREQYPFFLGVFSFSVGLGAALTFTIGRMISRATGGISSAIDVFGMNPLSPEANDEIERIPLELRPIAEAYGTMAGRVRDLLRQLAASSRVQALGDLSVVMAHDLRNPLQVIKMNAQMGKTTGDARTHPHFEQISSSADYINQLIGRILSLACSPEENIEQVDLGDVVDKVTSLAEMMARHHDIVVESNAEPGLPRVRGDRIALEQALVNLIANAIHAMPEGGTITVSASAVKDGTLITVSDTGQGIPEDVKRDIFQKFFTTRGNGGLGLGLAIVESIVINHGGRVWCDSETGVGTTFYIHLPASETG